MTNQNNNQLSLFLHNSKRFLSGEVENCSDGILELSKTILDVCNNKSKISSFANHDSPAQAKALLQKLATLTDTYLKTASLETNVLIILNKITNLFRLEAEVFQNLFEITNNHNDNSNNF